MFTYFMHSGKRVVRKAPYSEITHFLAESKYVIAHTGKMELVLDETLKEIESNHDDLVRIHRSTLVKVGQIKRIVTVAGTHDHFAVLDSGVQLPISRRHISDIRMLVNTSAYKDADGWRDAGYSLGVIKMPAGYILTKKERMYRWMHPDSGLVSAAKRDKWVVYRDARAVFKLRSEAGNE